MNKWKKNVLIGITGIVVIAIGTGITLAIALPHMPPLRVGEAKPFKWTNESLGSYAVLSAEEVRADATQLIQIVEETHPVFLEEEPTGYQKAKTELLHSVDKAMRLNDFQLLLNKYMTSLQDGHTQVYWDEWEWLQFSWQCSEQQLFVLDDKGMLTKDKVVTIGGMPVEKLMRAADSLFPAENLPAHESNYDTYLRSKRFLTLQGIKVEDTVEMEVLKNGRLNRIQVGFGEMAEMSERNQEISGRALNATSYLVTLKTCEVNANLEKTIEGLKKAIAWGSKRIIIDVSDNPGGDSEACRMVLEAMGMKPGQFGSLIRYSPLAHQERGIFQTKGSFENERSNIAVSNPNIELYVITNKGTFSSAQWLATWVKDGKLGKVVGQPSSNKPSSFGDVLHFQLANSKLVGSISFKKWLRPDSSRNDEPVLEPDIYVETGVDPIEVIMGMEYKRVQ